MLFSNMVIKKFRIKNEYLAWIIYAFIVTYEIPDSYTLGIFSCINLFFNVFLVRTWNLLHMMWILYQKTKLVSSTRCIVSPSILYYPMVSCWPWDLPILSGIVCLGLIVCSHIFYIVILYFPLNLQWVVFCTCEHQNKNVRPWVDNEITKDNSWWEFFGSRTIVGGNLRIAFYN